MLRSFLRSCIRRLTHAALGKKVTAHGIVIGELDHSAAGGQDFASCIKQALDLLRRYDPPRFRRVKRSLSFIYSGSHIASTGKYLPLLNACSIDISQLGPEWRENETFLHYLAAVIVHEATHGEVRRRTHQRDWTREEPHCNREQWDCFEALTRMSGIEIDAEWLAERKRYDPRFHRVYYNTSRWTLCRKRLQRIYGGDSLFESLRRAFRGQTADDLSTS